MLLCVIGTGTIRISFRQINAGSMFSRLSGVNIWNYELTLSDIYRLSLGCGGVTGNLLQWFDLRREAESTGQVSELQGPSCTYRDGKLFSCHLHVSSVGFAFTQRCYLYYF